MMERILKVYFIRHGQTTCNVGGVHQGWGPIRLTALGKEQAKRARDKLSGEIFEKYYCSDLLRTRQTAEIVFPEIYHGGEFIFDENLREIDTGAYFGRSPAELTSLYGAEYDRRRRIMDLGPYGAESSEHLKSRVRRFMKRLEADAETHRPEKLAVVTHGGIIRTFALLASGLPEELIERLPAGTLRLNIGNCTVSIFDYSKAKGWSIDSIGI